VKFRIFTSENGREPPDSDPRLQLNPFIYKGFLRVLGQSYTGFFTCLAARSENCYCSAIAHPRLAHARGAASDTLINMSETMKHAFGLVRRPCGVFYLKNKSTGEQKSLKTSDKLEAQRILQAHNETESQPHFNLSLARVYLNGADPKLATRTWQEVMENIVAKKTDETRHRWDTAIKDRNFDCIRKLHVAETRPEHFDRALADGKVSTNVYLRRIHNHALGMEWLLKSVIPRLQWPKPVFKEKRAITAEEHAAIIGRELNTERRDFYELLWLTGAAQSDGACLRAEDINWETRTICFTRKKLKSRGTSVKPTLFRFSADIEAILKRRPTSGQLFPYLATVRAGDRATEFKQRCDGLGISGVSLHCYRTAWAERALKCGFPERFAQQALGHNSKAVHRAYAKHAEVTVPSLDEWEKEWQENPQRSVQRKLLPVNFRLPLDASTQSN
jgi:site-specific recombinase XerD